MTDSLLHELKTKLAESDSAMRKHWTHRIVEEDIALDDLVSLLHGAPKTVERFTWLLGDVCETDPDRVAACMPLLYSLRNQMPFVGMHRSVAKWLWLTNVPKSIEESAVEQLFEWMHDPDISIGCKSYAAKAILELAKQKRAPISQVRHALIMQEEMGTEAYRQRMRKLLQNVESLDDDIN